MAVTFVYLKTEVNYKLGPTLLCNVVDLCQNVVIIFFVFVLRLYCCVSVLNIMKLATKLPDTGVYMKCNQAVKSYFWEEHLHPFIYYIVIYIMGIHS